MILRVYEYLSLGHFSQSLTNIILGSYEGIHHYDGNIIVVRYPHTTKKDFTYLRTYYCVQNIPTCDIIYPLRKTLSLMKKP